jgi:uncharacterized protein
MKKIAVFSKKPEPGKTKTRLIPNLSKDEAMELSESLLKDTITLINDISYIDKKVMYASPPGSLEYFQTITQSAVKEPGKEKEEILQWQIKIQEGKNLGDRFLNAMNNELTDDTSNSGNRSSIPYGNIKLIIIGSDSPAIPLKYIEEAFSILEKTDIVLGPAEDGGFYLIGVKKTWPDIFNSVRWSASYTLSDIIANLEKSSLNYIMLPQWYDIDEIKDLAKLNNDLKVIPDSYCKNTRKILNKLNKKLKIF